MSAGDPQDEAFDRYLDEVAQQPPLSITEEARLAHLARAGDEEAGRALVKSTLPLVVTLARSYQAAGIPLRDLVYEGNAGLVEAAEKFDPSRGFRFSTYAAWWIRQSMTKAIAKNGRVGSAATPAVLNAEQERVQTAWDALVEREGRQPTLAELAEELGMSASRLSELLRPPDFGQ